VGGIDAVGEQAQRRDGMMTNASVCKIKCGKWAWGRAGEAGGQVGWAGSEPSGKITNIMAHRGHLSVSSKGVKQNRLRGDIW